VLLQEPGRDQGLGFLVVFGYRFEYRRQFGLVSSDYAKLQRGHSLGQSLITLDYAYLSWTYCILGKLKIRRRQLHGGSIPTPGTI
jgi:hypothetical protein